jgi:spermidine synthase
VTGKIGDTPGMIASVKKHLQEEGIFSSPADNPSVKKNSAATRKKKLKSPKIIPGPEKFVPGLE